MLKIITPAVTNDLTTLDSLKFELDVQGDEQDAALSGLIRQASDTIASFCGLSTFGRQRVEQIERNTFGKRGVVLELDILPEIHTVTEDGFTLSVNQHYVEDAGVLYRNNGYLPGSPWAAGWNTAHLVINYSAGHELLGTLPADVERCALDLCAHYFHSKGRDPTLRSERILDVIESRWAPVATGPGSGGIPESIAERLRPYRKARVS